MRNFFRDHNLICPVCSSPLRLDGDELACGSCSRCYPIEKKIAKLLPPVSTRLEATFRVWGRKYEEQASTGFNLTPAWGKGFLYLDKFLRPRKGTLSLEAGCGIALGSLHLASKGVFPVCVDVSGTALEISQKIFKEFRQDGCFIQADILHLPFARGIFDYVFAGGVLEHFRNTSEAIKGLYRVLKKGGKIFTTVPTISLSMLTYGQLQGNIPDLPLLRPLLEFFHFKILRQRFTRNGFELSFTLRRTRKLFIAGGFKEIEIGYFDIPLEIKYINSPTVKSLFNTLAKNRLLWPMIYIYARK